MKRFRIKETALAGGFSIKLYLALGAVFPHAAFVA